jgi:hypothetical protein
MGGINNIKRWLEPKEELLFYSDGTTEGKVDELGKSIFPNNQIRGGMVTGTAAVTDLRVFGVLGGLVGNGTIGFEWITNYDYAVSRIKNKLQYEGRKLPKDKSPKDLGPKKSIFGMTIAEIYVASDVESITRKHFMSTYHTIGAKVLILEPGSNFYEFRELQFNKPVIQGTDSKEEIVDNAYDVVLAVIQKQLRAITSEKIAELHSLITDIYARK